MAAPPVPNWQAQILRGVGAKPTVQNLLFANDWAKAEGGSASNNPFNTTQHAPGAGSYNSVGVRNYTSPQQGIQATIDTLNNGRYQPIIDALRSGTSAKAAADALAASPWGTGSLVQKMLGGAGGAVPSSSVAPSFASAPPSPTPPASTGGAGISPLLGQLLSQTNQMVGLGASPTLESLLSAAPSAPATSTHSPLQAAWGTPGGATVGGKAGQGQKGLPPLSSVGGVQVDSAIAPTVAQFISRFGVTPTSGYRSAAHNAAVGGATHSDHLSGDAVDFSGNPQALAALYAYAQGRFPYVEPMAQAKDHVHISLRRP